jgi:formylglycine-generating enzyme required for sulfatase activity
MSATHRLVLLVTAIATACGSKSTEVYVPEGVFISGGSIYWGVGRSEMTREGYYPRHLHAFYADRRLVHESEMQSCVDARACAAPGPDPYPMGPEVRTTFENALAYCRWRGKRLPTPDEFERMARGTDGWPLVCSKDPYVDCQRSSKSREGIEQLYHSNQWVDVRDDRFPAGAAMGFGVAVWIHAPDPRMSFRCVRTAPTGARDDGSAGG